MVCILNFLLLSNGNKFWLSLAELETTIRGNSHGGGYLEYSISTSYIV